jgi:hypothetical protein
LLVLKIGILQIIMSILQVAAFAIVSPVDKTTRPRAEDAWHKRCFKFMRGVKHMKKYLLLPLVALGLLAWVPNQAKAGVHVTFGFGVPTYYRPYYDGYYPGYQYYYYPYWHHRHHYYHHYRHWHRW